MKLGFFFIILCLSIVFISYITYNINEYMGNSLQQKEINFSNKKCHLITIPTTINQLIPLNEQFLIGAEYKFLDIYNFKAYLTNKIYDENLYLINTKNEKYSKIKIMDFPKRVPFHPHGLSLYKKSESDYILYLVNHAVNDLYDGEERIEKINVNFNSRKEEVNMIYDSTIVLPKEYFLKIDSITVINEDIFYFTTNNPFPSPTNSEVILDLKNNLLNIGYDYLKSFMNMLNIKNCYVYRYNKNKVGNETDIISNSKSLLNKGIAYDKKRNLLYVVKAMEKQLNIFEINFDGGNYETKYIKSIPILYVGNNIYYDEKTDLIYIGIDGKMNEFDSIVYSYMKNKNFDEVDTFSGYEIINPNNNYSIYDLMVMKNDFKWVSSAIQINEKNYMSSIFTNGIYVCQE